MGEIVAFPREPKRDGKGLTTGQKKCWEYVTQYEAKHGHLPTFDEIASVLGLRSKAGAVRTMAALFERGLVKRP